MLLNQPLMSPNTGLFHTQHSTQEKPELYGTVWTLLNQIKNGEGVIPIRGKRTGRNGLGIVGEGRAEKSPSKSPSLEKC